TCAMQGQPCCKRRHCRAWTPDCASLGPRIGLGRSAGSVPAPAPRPGQRPRTGTGAPACDTLCRFPPREAPHVLPHAAIDSRNHPGPPAARQCPRRHGRMAPVERGAGRQVQRRDAQLQRGRAAGRAGGRGRLAAALERPAGRSAGARRSGALASVLVARRTCRQRAVAALHEERRSCWRLPAALVDRAHPETLTPVAAEADPASLVKVVALLGAAVVAVPLFRKLGLGSVLGYLAAGLVIGPFGLGWFSHPQSILHFAELGVVMFLFVVGLEMRPSHLWGLRRQIFGLGTLQIGLATLALTAVGLGFGFTLPVAFIGG